MDAGLFIYFPRDPGHNIYFKVLTESTESTVRPLTKKRDQFQPFPNSTDCHTKHIAMIHGLWPSSIYEYKNIGNILPKCILFL